MSSFVSATPLSRSQLLNSTPQILPTRGFQGAEAARGWDAGTSAHLLSLRLLSLGLLSLGLLSLGPLSLRLLSMLLLSLRPLSLRSATSSSRLCPPCSLEVGKR